MADIHIQQLDWNDWSRRHIWDRHHLTPKTVEEVCYSDPTNLHIEQTYNDRYLVVGPASDGKLYAVVLVPQATIDHFFPISARRASKKERRDYQAWKVEQRHE